MTVSTRKYFVRAMLAASCFFSAAALAQTPPTAEEPAASAETTAAPVAVEQAGPVAIEQAAPAAAHALEAAAIDCVEVKLFDVADDGSAEGQTARAAGIPAANLEIVRARIVEQLPLRAKGVQAVASGQADCPNPSSAAVLAGDILDFRKGNMALRYFIGFGAGTQKVKVNARLSRKVDDAKLAEATVSDAKWGGIIGGTNTKGLRDFADKVVAVAVTGLAKR